MGGIILSRNISGDSNREISLITTGSSSLLVEDLRLSSDMLGDLVLVGETDLDRYPPGLV